MVIKSELPAHLERLAEVLADIRRRFPDTAVRAIPWIRFKHPIHPTQMELADPTGCRPGQPLFVGLGVPFRFGRCLLAAVQMTLKLALLRFRLRRALSELKRRPFDLIAKTWAYPKSMLAGWNDFYYGDLQRRLARHGVRTLLLIGKPENPGWPDFFRARSSSGDPAQLPELALVPLSVPLRCVLRQLPVALRLLRDAGRAPGQLQRRVLLQASRDELSGAVTAVLMYDWIGREAARLWHPKAVIALYEGYSWEECLWRGVRLVDPSCRTVGYQHTILLRHNLTLLRMEPAGTGRFRPDVLLCLGHRTEEMLRPSHPDSDCFSFGTFRTLPPPTFRSEPRPEKRTVLVVPTGYPDETRLLFNVSLRAARNLPDHRFIFRTHPVLPLEQVLPHLEENPAGLANVEISRDTPIQEDFARSSSVLYRGSSSVLYAVLHGLKPVFFSDRQFPDQDPLFEIDTWPERVSSVRQLEECLRRYAAADPATVANPWRAAAEYAASYTVPVEEAAVDRLLSSVGLRPREAVCA